jgi:hypothetical protein
MGCDIHAHVEVRFRGQWVHYNAPHVTRHYDLFAKLAGVRNDETNPIKPIAEPRGLPDNVSDLTRAIYEAEGGSEWTHSASYLTADEMREVGRWYDTLDRNETQGGHHGFEGVFGYLNGNSIASLGDGLVEDARLVFWFDN